MSRVSRLRGLSMGRALWASACGGVPLWPVGVPPAGANDDAARMDATLPLCGGQPAPCDQLSRLQRLLDAMATRCSGAGGARSISPDVTSLLEALAVAPPPVSSGFPGSFEAAPLAFRERDAQAVLDARQPQLDVSAAVLFHGVWWTFWDRSAISENPTSKSGAFSDLTVFPDFAGREPCKEW